MKPQGLTANDIDIMLTTLDMGIEAREFLENYYWQLVKEAFQYCKDVLEQTFTSSFRILSYSQISD